MRRVLVGVVGVLLLLVLACGGPSADPPPTLHPLATVVPVAPVATPSGFQTATPWPTFTPLPPDRSRFDITIPPILPTDAPRPEATPLMVAPSALPSPTPSGPLPSPDVSGLQPDRYLATPTRPFVQYEVPGLDMTVRRQTVFMTHYPEPPSFFPTPASIFYTRTARFIGWWVDFDYDDVDPDFEMEGVMRLVKLTNGELVMHQEPYRLTHGRGLFLMLGDEVPGTLWFPGFYRFEAWDNRDRVMVHYDFEVRSGVVH